MLAPVIIFVYNRPEHTKKTIECLAKNNLSKETEVFIFSDGPKNNDNGEKVTQVRSYIELVSKKDYFKSVKISMSNENRGLAKSVIDGVSAVINSYGKAIVVEDDLITSVEFLQYMNDALEFYECKRNIWSISGYNLPIKMPIRYKHNIYYSLRGASWGWATWANRWNKVDWEVKDYDDFARDKELRKKFNKGGRDLSYMLDMQMAGEIDSWAIRWVYSQFKLNTYTVYPVNTKVINIGMDGSGTHSRSTKRFFSEFSNDKTGNTYFEEVDLSRIIITRFSNYYMSSNKYILTSILRRIRKIIKNIKEGKDV